MSNTVVDTYSEKRFPQFSNNFVRVILFFPASTNKLDL
jgi:hypothetical protein